MRTLILLTVLAAMAALPACKSQQMALVEPPAEPTVQPVQEEVVEIPVRTERFTIEKEEEAAPHALNRFFVILGSFRVPENAEAFQRQLEARGFEPVILLSETGYHRVCVNSYTSEGEARRRVLHIRDRFPEFHDAWLLIREE